MASLLPRNSNTRPLDTLLLIQEACPLIVAILPVYNKPLNIIMITEGSKKQLLESWKFKCLRDLIGNKNVTRLALKHKERGT